MKNDTPTKITACALLLFALNLNAASLVAHWTLDDGTNSTTARDVSSSLYDGTYVGGRTEVAGATAYTGSAVSLSGSGQYINVPDNADLNLENTESFTISCWVATATVGQSQDSRPWGKLSGGSIGGYSLILQGGSIKVQLRDNNGAEVSVLPAGGGGTGLNDAQWHHVVVLYDGTAGSYPLVPVVRVYVDGQQVAMNTGGAMQTSWVHTSDFAIGRGGGSDGFNGNAHRGSIDDVWFFKGLLNTNQIAGLFQAGALLIGRWGLNDATNGVGGVTSDLSGNGYDGTYENSVTNALGARPFTGNSAQFSNGGYADIPVVPDFNFENTEPFSIACWVKTTSSGDHRPWGKLGGSGASAYSLIVQGGSSLKAQFRDINGVECGIVSSSPITVGDGNWHHIAVVYYGGTNYPLVPKVLIYLDGVSIPTTTFASMATGWIHPANFAIARGGGANGFNGNAFNGSIDEVWFFRGVLAQQQVVNLRDFNQLVIPPGPPIIGVQPTNQTVLQARPVTFSVVVSGVEPITNQWYKSGSLIPGATNSSYTLAEAMLSDNQAEFYLVASNAFGSATSSNAILTVIADSTLPTVLRGLGSVSLTNATLIFSEPLKSSTVLNLNNYSFSGGLQVFGTSLSPDRTRVTLTTGSQTPGGLYVLTINSVQDLAGNSITPNTQVNIGNVFLVGHWSLDDAGTTNALDSSGLTNHGTYISNPVSDSGARPFTGTSAAFNGGSQYVDIRDNADFNFENNEEFSVSCWVKTLPNLSQDGRPWGKLSTGNASGFSLNLVGGSQIKVQLRDVAGGEVSSFASGSPPVVNDGTWHHIVVTYSGGGGNYPLNATVRCYVDGSEISMGTPGAFTRPWAHTGNFGIASGGGSDGFLFNKLAGSMDETWLFRGVLTPGQVTSLYNSNIINFATVPQVRLDIASGANNTYILSWPSSVTNFVLQSTTSLSVPFTPASEPSIVVGGNNTVTVTNTGSNRYFRLKD